MRPKKPESISSLSFSSPGSQSLSCTTPCFTPARSRRGDTDPGHPPTVVAVGFSTYTCLPASIALRTSAGRSPVEAESK